jgi:hypothetical protein
MKPAYVLFGWAGFLLLGGVIAFLLAPKGANAKTALIIPGACAVLAVVCGLFAERTAGATSGTVLAFAFAVLCGWRAWSAGGAVRAYQDGQASFERAVAEKRFEPTDAARERFLEESGAPSHDKSYLRNLLWVLAVASFAACILLLWGPRP